jgi:hypothetical protein
VRDLPTSFGPISFTIAAGPHSLRVLVSPTRTRPHSLRLRLRLPGAERIRRLSIDGRPSGRFNEATDTIDLSGLRGRVRLSVEVS